MGRCRSVRRNDIDGDMRLVQRIGIGSTTLYHVATASRIALEFGDADKLIDIIRITTIQDFVGIIRRLPFGIDEAVVELRLLVRFLAAGGEDCHGAKEKGKDSFHFVGRFGF